MLARRDVGTAIALAAGAGVSLYLYLQFRAEREALCVLADECIARAEHRLSILAEELDAAIAADAPLEDLRQ